MLLVESCLAPRTAKLELAGSNITPNGLDSDYMNLFIRHVKLSMLRFH